jgi:hypothetical protein
MNGYASGHFLAFPDDLIKFAWSAPMRELAGQIGISDVGLKKLLRTNGIPTPPQGHWNRVHAGRRVPDPPPSRPRRPGESGRIRLDARFEGLVAEAAPVPEGGPFVSAAVPESLEALQEQEAKAIGRIPATRTLDRPHPALAPLLKREEQRRQKQEASGWSWGGPHWAGPLAQRQLNIVDALFRALARRDHSGEARASQSELAIHCTIGDRQLELAFGPAGRRRERHASDRALSGDLPANTPLRLSLLRSFRAPVAVFWEDGEKRLERRIGTIATDLIVAGEAAFRESLVEAREHAKQVARWREERRAAALERLHRKRLTDLTASGELLRQAGEIRALVEQVKAAVEAGSIDVSPDQLARWEGWALGQADRLDPVLSGQVLSHLAVPELDGEAGSAGSNGS